MAQSSESFVALMGIACNKSRFQSSVAINRIAKHEKIFLSNRLELSSADTNEWQQKSFSLKVELDN